MGSDFYYYVGYEEDGTECDTNTDLRDLFNDSFENIVVDGSNGIFYF